MLRGHVSSVDAVTRRRVTFSRNLTLSLSRTCVSHCSYCAFATHQPHLHEPDEVRRLLDHAARRNVKELLILTGDDPGPPPRGARAARRARLRGLRRLRRVVLPRGARARPAAAHQPRRARARRSRPSARGDRLAGSDARVDLRAADGDRSPTAAPRPSIRRFAWRRSAPRASCASRSPAASSSASASSARSASRRSMRWRAATREYGHIQELILQNFVPHRRYYGEEPADDRDRRGGGVLAHRPRPPPGAAAARLGLRGGARGDPASWSPTRASCCPTSASRCRPTSPTPGRRSSPRGRAISAGCPPTATTSRPSIRSPRRTRSAAGSRATASR